VTRDDRRLGPRRSGLAPSSTTTDRSAAPAARPPLDRPRQLRSSPDRSSCPFSSLERPGRPRSTLPTPRTRLVASDPSVRQPRQSFARDSPNRRERPARPCETATADDRFATL
jgi:hypothetical protein